MRWSLDYRGYSVDPPCEGFRRTWQGMPMLNGMPAVTAHSEADLRKAIDRAHDLSPPRVERVFE